MKIDFKNKYVLITGASRGIGNDIANSFFLSGANIITTSTKPFKVKNSKKRNIWINFIVDFNDDISISKFLINLKKFKKIDILINNAGINKINEINKIDSKEWDTINKVNLRSPYLISKAVSKIMIKLNKGYIINVSSIFGVISKEKRASYSASKSGLIGLTRAVALDLAKYNILVNSISPGFVETELTNKILLSKEKKLLKQNVPLKRFAKKDEITKLLFFLCSKYNTYITGQNIIIDGGFSIK
jgi:3-oxoacyl-[acyl-carrier protein] reductase